MHTSIAQLQKLVKDRFIMCIPSKDKAGIRHWPTIDLPLLNSQLHMITPRIMRGATITKKECISNRLITSEGRIARDAQSRILND
ncbi:MAG: hypothetical protein EZS28_016822 [Streblomastix strix]|uniref:Uncharacterized protein n=1 Tax=Streblomastix strix TaxID=222440 RepID=A0A5J4VYC1_9EUKA|nr:MAG: hypothetical protein EZS28_016822 [Streblomastix strix]